MKRLESIGVGIGLCIVTITLYLFGVFSNIEFALRDRLILERPIHPDLLIVAIDNASLATLGQWPFPRKLVAEGLEVILSGNPRQVAVDVIFADPSRYGDADDQALETVFRESKVNIVLPLEGQELRIKGEIVPTAETTLRTLPRMTGPQIAFGHVNLILDRDGLVRRFPETIMTSEGERVPAFSLVAAHAESHAHLPTIVYSGKPGTIPQISFASLFESDFNPRILEGKIVFVGSTATNLHDEQPTPVSAGTPMSGVEIQAQIANMSLMGYALVETPSYIEIPWILALVLLPLALFLFVKRIGIALFATILLFVGNTIFLVILFDSGFAGPIVHTSLALILSGSVSFTLRYFVLDRERREIRNVFSKYVSKDVLEELLKDTTKVKLGGEEAEVTVLFSDVRGFTTLSESLSPTELTTFLNRYLTAMTDIILEGRGVIDKYIGDAIMAFWGAPLKNERHAIDAILSSLSMLAALDAFNAESKNRGEPLINIGIGLNTGKVTVGNMGSHQRFDYTIMGDAVNLGSRLEGQTKDYGVRLLISENTLVSLREEDKTTHNLLIRELDKVTVKGKAKPVAIYEVVERKNEVYVKNILETFNALRDAYYRGAWQAVIDLGTKIKQQCTDGPTEILFRRAETFLIHPPEHWEGVYKLTSK